MSIAYETYVGPYARCVIAMVPVTSVRTACVNAVCPNHEREKDGAFCQLCGSATGDVAYTELDESVDQWAVSEALGERLTTPGGDAECEWRRTELAHLWMPNVSTPWRDGHLESREAFALIGIGETQIGDEIAAFRDFFAPELTILREHYGDQAVTVQWGIIQHYY